MSNRALLRNQNRLTGNEAVTNSRALSSPRQRHRQNGLTLANSAYASVATAIAASTRVSSRSLSNPAAYARFGFHPRRMPMAARRSLSTAMSLSSPRPSCSRSRTEIEFVSRFAARLLANRVKKLHSVAEFSGLDAQFMAPARIELSQCFALLAELAPPPASIARRRKS